MPPLTLTDAQHTAVSVHDRDLVVEAGAGSGKTRVLVERYLALLDANPDWPLSALVAITFTRKAAGEMRDRVRQRLEEGFTAAQSAAEQARWAALLGAMDSARIDTIHGLCSGILRANAAEVPGLDPGFRVLEEVEMATLRRDAVDKVLADLRTDDPVLALFDSFELREIRDSLDDPALMAADLIDIAPEEWLALWQEDYAERIGGDVDALFNGDALWALRKLRIPDAVPDSDALRRVFVDVVQTARAAEHGELDMLIIAASYLAEAITLRGGSKKAWGDETFAEVKGWLKTVKAQAQAIADQAGGLSDYDTQAAQRIPLWVTLAQRVQTAYRDAKARLRGLDFDDLETLTAALLKEQPQTAARYHGTEYRHILVDEFQDTNARQWAIIRALAGTLGAGRLFIVGDPKQSIYGFRGADVRVFRDVSRQLTRDTQDAHVTLAQSFRTHAPLVDQINALFGALLRGADQVAYTPMTAFRADPPSDAPPLEAIVVHHKRGDGLDMPAVRRREADALAARLHQLIDTGRPIADRSAPDGLRPMRWGDVAVLMQSLSSVTIYEDAFHAAGVPFLTIAGRGYFERPEVSDLLNLLHALHDANDDLSLAAALRSPLFGLSDDALYALRRPSSDARGTLWQALTQAAAGAHPVPEDDRPALDAAYATLSALKGLAGRVTTTELLRAALDRTGYRAVLSGLPGGDQRRANVEKLLEVAQQSSQRVTLSDFTAYLRDLARAEIREGSASSAADAANLVQIMSVHRSKGLEFPVVVIADASWAHHGGQSGPWRFSADGWVGCKLRDDAGEWRKPPPYGYALLEAEAQAARDAERRRTFYVAATRAQDLLIISGTGNAEKAPPTASGWLGDLLTQADALDLPVQVVQDDLPSRTPDTQPDAQPSVDALPAGSPPPLLMPVPPTPPPSVRHITATALADLGAAEVSGGADRRFYLTRFRRDVLDAAPTVVRPLMEDGALRAATPRQIGEIVHRALQYGHLPTRLDADHLLGLLRGYAWDEGITEARALESAVQRAQRLLDSFTASPVYQRILEAEAQGAVYRELPFIYEREQHVIHGVIDLLMRDAAGQWVVLDYKTSSVYVGEGQRPTPAHLQAHVQRYVLQVGIYAEAVRQYLGGSVTPETWVHYIRYGHTLRVAESAWTAALAGSLGARIDAASEAP